MNDIKELASQDIRFYVEYWFGSRSSETHIYTTTGNRYVFDTNEFKNKKPKTVFNFMARALNARCIVNLGYGNRLYYNKQDKGLIKCLYKIYSKCEFPPVEIYKHWEEYIRKVDSKNENLVR